MGSIGSQTPRVVLRTDLQLFFNRNHVKNEVAEFLKTWFQEGAPLSFQFDAFRHFLGVDARDDLEHFFRAFDTNQNQKVDAFEVLCAVVVLAEGNIEEKLEAIIPMFDFAGSAKLNFDEANILLQSVCRGLQKVCETPQLSDEDIVESCRHMFDAHNLVYKAEISKEQLKRWVRQDIEAVRFLDTFCMARSLVDVEAALAQREQSQTEAFTQLSGDTQSVQPQDLMRNRPFRESLGNPSDEVLRSLTSAMAGDTGSINLEGFVSSLRDWNAFDAVDVDGEGYVDTKNISLLLWYRQHQEPSREQIRRQSEAIGPCEDERITRVHWIAAGHP